MQIEYSNGPAGRGERRMSIPQAPRTLLSSITRRGPLINHKYHEALSTEEKAVEMDPANPELKNRMDRFQKVVRLLALP